MLTCWGCPELVITGYDADSGGIMTESLLLVPALIEPLEGGRENVIIGHDGAAGYIADVCPPGSKARYDVDDGLDHAPGTVFAEVHCTRPNHVNLNGALVRERFAAVSEPLCGASEFAGSWWAKGCRD